MRSIFFIVSMALFVVSCGSKKIPVFDKPIYVLDNRDPTHVVLRYKGTVDVKDIDDSIVRGAVVFLPDDFVAFTTTYIGGCLKWEEGVPLDTVENVLKDTDLWLSSSHLSNVSQ